MKREVFFVFFKNPENLRDPDCEKSSCETRIIPLLFSPPSPLHFWLLLLLHGLWSFSSSPPLSLSKDWLPLLTRSPCSSTMSAGTYLDNSGAKSGQESTGQCQSQHSPSLKPGPQCTFSGGRVPLTDSTCLGMSYPWAGVFPSQSPVLHLHWGGD